MGRLVFVGLLLGFAWTLACPAVWAVCLPLALGALVS